MSVVKAGKFEPNFVIPNNLGLARSGAEGWGLYADSAKLVYETGGRWMRSSCGWSIVEPSTKGSYSFDCLNSGIKTALNNNLSMVVVLFGSNKLYIEDGYAPYNDTHRDAFVGYANATVNHWKGRGIIWELWNEPDGQANFWKPARNATSYMLLFKAVSKLFKENYPNEILGGAAVSYFYMDFLETMFKNGLLELADVFTIHPYRGSSPETLILSSQFEKSWPELKTLMAKYTPAGKYIPLVQTEYGYSLTSGPAKNNTNNQANLLARTYLINMRYGVSPILWYDWMDDCADQSKNDCTMGLIRFKQNSSDPIVKKPTFYAFQTLASLLWGYQYASTLNTTNSTADFAITFQHSTSGITAVAVWTSNAVVSHNVVIQYNVAAACFNAYNTFKESMGRICSDNSSRLTVSLEPNFVAYLIPVTAATTTGGTTASSPSSSTTGSNTSPSSTGDPTPNGESCASIISISSLLLVICLSIL